MAINIYSGKSAYINGVQCVQNWQATEGATAQRYSASCVAGATNVGPPIVNWAGQAGGVGQKPTMFPTGSNFVFQGVVNSDATEGDLHSLNGTVLVEQLTIDINKENNAPIQWQSTYSFQGTPTEAATSATDSADADAMYGNNLGITIGATSLAANKIRSAQLVMRRPITSYVSGGTTLRKAGPLEADISFTLWESSLAVAAYAAGTLDYLKVFVSGTAYWAFSKARFLGKSAYVVDRSSNAIVGYTVNAQWNAKDGATAGWLSYFDGSSFTNYFGTGS